MSDRETADQELAQQLLDRARAERVKLTCPDGPLGNLTESGRFLAEPTEVQSAAECGGLAVWTSAVAMTLLLVTFCAAFFVIFSTGPRQWAAETFLGCESEVVTRQSPSSSSEPAISFECRRGGQNESIDLLLAGLGFAPFVAVASVSAIGIVTSRQLRLRRRRRTNGHS